MAIPPPVRTDIHKNISLKLLGSQKVADRFNSGNLEAIVRLKNDRDLYKGMSHCLLSGIRELIVYEEAHREATNKLIAAVKSLDNRLKTLEDSTKTAIERHDEDISEKLKTSEEELKSSAEAFSNGLKGAQEAITADVTANLSSIIEDHLRTSSAIELLIQKAVKDALAAPAYLEAQKGTNVEAAKAE